MTDNSIVLNVWITAVEGREQELGAQLRALLLPTRREAGCLAYKLHRDPKDPLKFMFYEHFADQAALDVHLSSPHFRTFSDYRATGVDPIAQQTVTVWRVLEPPDMPIAQPV